jgi:hypothetical protein
LKQIALVLWLAVLSTPLRAFGAVPIGTNLTGLSDWSTEIPLVDAFRTSRPWISGAASGAWDDGRSIATDANGWVTSLQPGQVARTLFYHEWDGWLPTGLHTVTYDGEGTLEYFGGASRQPGSVPGREIILVTGQSFLNITATNPSNYIRNIEIVPYGGICASDIFTRRSGPLECNGDYLSFEQHHETIRFTPEFLAVMKNYATLRFMDWMKTNHSTVRDWNDRVPMSFNRWRNGAPLELMVELINLLGVDGWFTVPHLATDDYARNFAATLKRLLGPGRKAYIEYSNEVWNSHFSQADHAQERGLAEGLSTNPFQAQLYWYSKRAVEIHDIFKQEFGSDPRLVRVMAAQGANPWTSRQVMAFQGAGSKVEVLAVAPYFSTGFDCSSDTVDDILERLTSDALPTVIDWNRGQVAVAQQHGVELVAYEGGQHLVGDGCLALLGAVNRDPRMKDVYLSYLESWEQVGGGLFVHFSDIGRWSQWGFWGAMEHLGQTRERAPKYDALMTYIERGAPPPALAAPVLLD